MTQVSTLGKLAVVTAGLLGIATACGSSTPSSSSSSGTSGTKIGGSLTVWGDSTAQEQKNFLAALQPFKSQTGITVTYQGKGNNMDTALNAAVAGGSPPDVALVPDPGTLQSLAKAGKIKDLTSILGGLSANYGSAWNTLASYNGKLYGVGSLQHLAELTGRSIAWMLFGIAATLMLPSQPNSLLANQACALAVAITLTVRK